MSWCGRILSFLYGFILTLKRCSLTDLRLKCRCENLEPKMQCKAFLFIFNAINNLVLVCALGCGLYVRWKDRYDPAFVYIGFAFLVVSTIAVALTYYFVQKNWITCLWRLYVGFVMGVVAFTDHSVIHDGSLEQAMQYLLMACIYLGLLFDILVRLFDVQQVTDSLFDVPGMLETLGMGVASVISGDEIVAILLLLVAVQVCLVTIRLKCFTSVLYLICIAVFTGIFYFPKLKVLHVSPVALSLFLCRVSVAPILDLYFLNKTRLERWTVIISKRAIFHKLLILAIVSVELVFLSLTAKHIVNHKEWFVVVPMFCALAFVWLCYHLVFVVQCWILSNKLAQCHQMYVSTFVQNRNFTQILASKGLRHFSLISQRLVCVTLLTSFLMGAIGWNTKTPTSFSLVLIVIPFETVVLSFLSEMGRVLGGACIGYALVAPSMENGLVPFTILVFFFYI